MRIFYEDLDPELEVELAAASEARAYAQYLADEAEKRRIEEEEWWALVLEEGVPIEA